MPFRKSSLMDSTGVGEMAEGWGKIVARRLEDQVGPDLDLDADDIDGLPALRLSTFVAGTPTTLIGVSALPLVPM